MMILGCIASCLYAMTFALISGGRLPIAPLHLVRTAFTYAIYVIIMHTYSYLLLLLVSFGFLYDCLFEFLTYYA